MEPLVEQGVQEAPEVREAPEVSGRMQTPEIFTVANKTTEAMAAGVGTAAEVAKVAEAVTERVDRLFPLCLSTTPW
jgi:hypothetical protein